MKKSKYYKLDLLNHHILIILGIIALVFVFFTFFVMNQRSSTSFDYSQNPDVITDYFLYTNEEMSFSVNIPNKFLITESFGLVTIKIPESEESIFIDYSGTNYDTVDKYLTDLEERNNSNVISSKTLTINGSEVAERLVKISQNETHKIYIHVKNYEVITMSTSSPSLYSDLDQIAQSFKYLGE